MDRGLAQCEGGADAWPMGAMKVYFNDMEKPYMTAKDKTFTWGQIGHRHV